MMALVVHGNPTLQRTSGTEKVWAVCWRAREPWLRIGDHLGLSGPGGPY